MTILLYLLRKVLTILLVNFWNSWKEIISNVQNGCVYLFSWISDETTTIMSRRRRSLEWATKNKREDFDLYGSGAFIIEFREMFVADRIKKLRALQNPDSQEAQTIIEELIRNERLDK